MFNSNKILGVLFVTLFLIFVGEIGYLFFSNKNAAKIPSNKGGDSGTICFAKDSSKLLFNEKLIQAYEHAPKDLLGELYLLNRLEGVVTEIVQGAPVEVNPDKYPNSTAANYESLGAIKLQKKDNGAVTEIIFPQANKDKTFFYEKNGDQLVPINFSDFKVGDQLEMEEKLDLLDKNCVSFLCSVELKVTKIQAVQN